MKNLIRYKGDRFCLTYIEFLLKLGHAKINTEVKSQVLVEEMVSEVPDQG